jgi:hypothetical protein
MALMT